jgi:orotidine-5'-phosphate decarboxylase
MQISELIQTIQEKQSYLCVGLDTDVTRLPEGFSKNKQGVIDFNRAIIDATLDSSVGYKINTAFYESMGIPGWEAMEATLAHIPSSHFTIADAKRGDIGNTSAQYAKTFFEILPFDSITVAPYMGEDSIRPFLEYKNKVTIVLGLTSNKGSADFQQLVVQDGVEQALVPSILQGNTQSRLFEKVMSKIASWSNPSQLMFVVGATQSSEIENIRNSFPEHFFLVPGVGFQGGSLQDISKYGLNEHGGLLVNASRAILYASSGRDFAEEAAIIAQQYHFEMKQLLQEYSRIN